MLCWITSNIATIIICALLFAAVFAIAVSMAKNKKKGKSYCGCGCEGCLMSDSCHPKK